VYICYNIQVLLRTLRVVSPKLAMLVISTVKYVDDLLYTCYEFSNCVCLGFENGPQTSKKFPWCSTRKAEIAEYTISARPSTDDHL
jgi:hypothetical protein